MGKSGVTDVTYNVVGPARLVGERVELAQRNQPRYERERLHNVCWLEEEHGEVS
jgi:hypothetical protein